MIEIKCPVCGKRLIREGGAYACADGHVYDVAHEGYVNLLLANKKNSKNPGDNKEMVRARDAFLEGGYYGFLADFLANDIAARVKSAASFLDCGCGSGYYLRKILTRNSEITACGVDISKEAVKIAAKRDKSSFYAVASVYDLPFTDEYFDVATCVFSPYAFTEYARVLKKGALIYVVYPAEKHLYEIKERLYGEDAYENDKKVDSSLFSKIAENTLSNSFYVEGEKLSSLLSMTPYFYKTDKNKIENLISAGGINVTASFNISIFEKK